MTWFTELPTPLERLESLDRNKQTAFLALCAAPRRNCQAARSSEREYLPDFGKAECGWIDDWRDFYQRELVALGLINLHEGMPRPAIGMHPGSVCWDVSIGITEDGIAARDAYYASIREKRAARGREEQSG